MNCCSTHALHLSLIPLTERSVKKNYFVTLPLEFRDEKESLIR